MEIHQEPTLRALFAPIFESLEAERLKILNRNFTIIGIGLGLILGGALLTYDLANPFYVLSGLLLGIFIYLIFADKGAKEWRYKYKTQVIDAIVKSFFGASGVYEPNNGHSEAEFMDTDLFNRSPDRYRAEDLIKGMVDKTLICFSEIHAEYKTKNAKGKTSWHTIFRGLLLTADFNKHFNGRTIVKQKSFWNFFSQGNIELENPIFNDEFSVFSDDSIEARYILSPSLMEKMLLLNKNWGGSLGFSFIRSQLKIAIPSYDNHFEISIWSKVESQNKWQKDWQIIADMVNIVHDLDLNTRIWTKE